MRGVSLEQRREEGGGKAAAAARTAANSCNCTLQAAVAASENLKVSWYLSMYREASCIADQKGTQKVDLRSPSQCMLGALCQGGAALKLL